MKKKTLFVLVLLVSLAVFSLTTAANGAGAPRVTSLSGAEEVNGGDSDGTGWANIWLNVGQQTVCWNITYSNLTQPVFAAHIHHAPAGVNGSIVVPLNPNTPGCTTADPALIQDIIDYPDQYYVNVHNVDFPGGAIRGQLSNPGQSDK